MSLARKYNRLLKRQLGHYAAWSPVTDRFEVGDFGAFRGGVFQRLGNIREFGVDPTPREGGSGTSFSYTSSGTVMVRSQAGVEVDVFPEASVEAALSIQFQGESSFYIRTGDLQVTEMDAIDAVAHQLYRKRDDAGRKWRLGWRVVRKVYVAEDPAILASSERGTTFSLTGDASALRNLEAGQASAELNVTSTQSDILEVLGGTGPVAIDLFKVRVGGRAGLVSFDPQAAASEDDEENGEVELDDDWWDDPEDDPDELII